jgi:hypothetical protein
MTILFDANVLIALAVEDHVHHEVVEHWLLTRAEEHFATTPITQGALVRLLLRNGVIINDAVTVLESFLTNPRHEMWPDDRPYSRDVLRGVIGHRQVTDAYLVSIAKAKNGVLATLDRGMAAAYPGTVELVPT